MKIFILITACREESTIGKAVEQIICPNQDLWSQLQLIITAPDEPTLKIAEDICHAHNFKDYRLIKDAGKGKALALNNAVNTITIGNTIRTNEDVLIMTDGDMFIESDAIKNILKGFNDASILGVGGHPVSLESKNSMFGYFSHLFCEAAHKRRLNDPKTPMSGYLYGIRRFNDIFPIPCQLRAEDAYISRKILDMGCHIGYAPKALAYVSFPKNVSDWFKQKTRSLGGNVQVSSSVRSIGQDLRMALFPLLYAGSPKELLWSLMLYPLRLYLWLRIYYVHLFNRYKVGMWDRVESSKY